MENVALARCREVFHRGIGHGMKLVKSMCAADPSHRNTGGSAVCAKSVSSAPYPR